MVFILRKATLATCYWRISDVHITAFSTLLFSRVMKENYAKVA